jgi:hypothetical protein
MADDRAARKDRRSARSTANALTTYLGWPAKDAAEVAGIPRGSAHYYVAKAQNAKNAVEFAEACKEADRQLMLGTYEVAFTLQKSLLELVASGELEGREIGWNLDKAMAALGKMRLWEQGTLVEDGQASRLDTILDRVLAVPEGGTLKLEVTRPGRAIDVTPGGA